MRLLQVRLRSAPERYEVVAMHIRGDGRGPDTPLHGPPVDWLHESGAEDIHLPPGEPLPMPCHRCSWNRRRTLFEVALRLGCNKVAFAHHLDDFAETVLMNLLYTGRVETMTPGPATSTGPLS